MTYQNTRTATFLSRPNRFIANVEVGGKVEVTHVKNTGRCKELLIKGAKVVVQQAANLNRKTKFDLIAVYKGNRLINMDSSAPNKAFFQYLQSGGHIQGITHIKPEAKWGNSRFDFYVEAGTRKIFIEVKGVTLEKNGVVLFPDAPTERGVRHLQELQALTTQDYEAQVVFVIQMDDVAYFKPNDQTHPAFGQALREAHKAGVAVFAFACDVEEDWMKIEEAVEVRL